MSLMRMGMVSFLFFLVLSGVAIAERSVYRDQAIQSSVVVDIEAQRTRCAEGRLYFEGACRPLSFFRRLVAPDARFVDAIGCATVALSADDLCGKLVTIIEEPQLSTDASQSTPGIYAQRQITLVSGSTLPARDSARAGRARLSDSEFRELSVRGRYPVILQTDHRFARNGGGRFQVVQDGRVRVANGALVPSGESILFFQRSNERAGDYAVDGRLCGISPQGMYENVGEPNCENFDYLSTAVGESIDCEGSRCDTCVSTLDADSGQRSAMFLEYRRLRNAVLPSLPFESIQPLRAQSDPKSCWQVHGRYQGSLGPQPFSDEASAGFSSTCGPEIEQLSVGVSKLACRGSAATLGSLLFMGDMALGLEVGFPLGVSGVNGRPLSIKNVYAELGEQFSSNEQRMDNWCGAVSGGISSTNFNQFFCGLSETFDSCDGIHENVPVIVTAGQSEQRCNASATLDCRSSSGDQSADFLSPECQCTPVSLNVDENSCS